MVFAMQCATKKESTFWRSAFLYRASLAKNRYTLFGEAFFFIALL
jgi:hypothetical protein